LWRAWPITDRLHNCHSVHLLMVCARRSSRVEDRGLGRDRVLLDVSPGSPVIGSGMAVPGGHSRKNMASSLTRPSAFS
jgi:hypothetical protein